MLWLSDPLYVKCDFEILLFLWGDSCWFFDDFNLMIWWWLLLNMTCELWGEGVSFWWWLFDEYLVINIIMFWCWLWWWFLMLVIYGGEFLHAKMMVFWWCLHVWIFSVFMSVRCCLNICIIESYVHAFISRILYPMMMIRIFISNDGDYNTLYSTTVFMIQMYLEVTTLTVIGTTCILSRV